MKLVGVKEISELLTIKKSTVYQWAELGLIPCYKINGAVRFSEKEVLEWVQSCRREPVRV